jgi:hypothetical protein
MMRARHHELKLARALRHIQDLEAEAARWLAKPPVKLHHTADLATAERLILAELLEPVPGELSAIAGDALHNLRSALDNLAYDLARAHTGEPLPKSIADDSMFPIFAEEKPETNKNLKRRLKGVHPEARALIRGMQPFNPGHGGRQNLRWVLSDLNVKDKHRLPPLAVPAASTVSFYVAGPGGALTATQKWPSLEVGGKVEISRYSSLPGIYAGPDLQKPPEFFIAFGEGSPEAVVGSSVVSGLREIHKDITERILPPLTPYLA